MKKLLALALCIFSVSFVTADEAEKTVPETTTEEVAVADENGTVDAQKAKTKAQEEKSACSSCTK